MNTENPSRRAAKEILRKTMKQDGFPLMEEEIAGIIDRETGIAEILSALDEIHGHLYGVQDLARCRDLAGQALKKCRQ